MNDFPGIFLGTFQTRDINLLTDSIMTCVQEGITGFDTAPSYGTEAILGEAIKQVQHRLNLKREDFYVSDKVDAWQMQDGNGEISCYIEDALKKMRTSYLDLLLIHWPIPDYMDSTWKCMLDLKNRELVHHIGICNTRVGHLKRIYERHGVYPDVIQIERHPLNTCDEVISFCKKNNIRIMAYSPLCRMHEDLQKSTILNQIAKNHEKNLGQIILRWHIDTGVVPVFMSQKIARIKENADIHDFVLSDNEIEQISSLNKNYKIFLESNGCPGYELD